MSRIRPQNFCDKALPGLAWSLLAAEGRLTSRRIKRRLWEVFGTQVVPTRLSTVMHWLKARGLVEPIPGSYAFWEAAWPLGELDGPFVALPRSAPERVSESDYLDLFQEWDSKYRG